MLTTSSGGKKGKDAKKPTRAEAKLVIKDFFGAAMLKECRWGKDRFFVTLIGDWSQPLTHVVSKELRKRIEATAPEPGWEGRHLEVWLGDDSLDVMTRMQDEYRRLRSWIGSRFRQVLARTPGERLNPVP